MTATIFTWPPDYLAAALAGRALRRCGVKVYLAVERGHPLPVVEGCEVVFTDFKRGGNLNGSECVQGILRTLAAHADGDEWTLKVDSDALVNGLGWLAGRGEEAVGLFHPGHRGFFGFCYALRTAALPGMIARAGELPEDPSLPEDVTIGELARPAWRYENLTPESPMAAYGWSGAKPVEEWKRRYEVLVFQRVAGKGRREVAAKMKEFLA